MTPYLFEGLILPERAQVSLRFNVHFTHVTSGIAATARISVVLNQVAVWIDTEVEWNIFDLRNVVKNILQNELALLAYLKGYAYEIEIRRVLNPQLQIDYVFGIDVPCIAERNTDIDLPTTLSSIRNKCIGPEGVLLYRCFNDLAMSMKNPEDTRFYCYRAVESLRQHCALKLGLSEANKSIQ